MSDQTLSSLVTLAILLFLLLWAFLIDFLLHLRRQRSNEPTVIRRSEGPADRRRFLDNRTRFKKDGWSMK